MAWRDSSTILWTLSDNPSWVPTLGRAMSFRMLYMSPGIGQYIVLVSSIARIMDLKTKALKWEWQLSSLLLMTRQGNFCFPDPRLWALLVLKITYLPRLNMLILISLSDCIRWGVCWKQREYGKNSRESVENTSFDRMTSYSNEDCGIYKYFFPTLIWMY